MTYVGGRKSENKQRKNYKNDGIWYGQKHGTAVKIQKDWKKRNNFFRRPSIKHPVKQRKTKWHDIK